jgi:hypothetical protein
LRIGLKGGMGREGRWTYSSVASGLLVVFASVGDGSCAEGVGL